jgi:hypothetical protein
MTEAEFWVELEYRLCRECQGLPKRRHQFPWCDGLIPGQYLFDESRPRITGVAWFGNDAASDPWEFALLLPPGMTSIETVDWAALLPPEDKTCWMSFDERRKYLEIEPGVARPDSD